MKAIYGRIQWGTFKPMDRIYWTQQRRHQHWGYWVYGNTQCEKAIKQKQSFAPIILKSASLQNMNALFETPISSYTTHRCSLGVLRMMLENTRYSYDLDVFRSWKHGCVAVVNVPNNRPHVWLCPGGNEKTMKYSKKFQNTFCVASRICILKLHLIKALVCDTV